MLLALPWQTRWFAEAPTLNGYPWEDGRFSLYGSWVLLVLATIITVLSAKDKQERGKGWARILPLLVLAFLLPTVFGASPLAGFVWWSTTLAAVLVFVVIRSSRLSFSQVAFWFSLGLVPHLLLGFSQAMFQISPDFSWLGLAVHDPATLGTSVVEWSGGRFLRAYGGFPHPNIFGGWLAVSLVLLSSIAYRVSRIEGYGLWVMGYGALGGAMLILTFSRSAWIAALLGCVLMFVLRWKKERAIQKSWPVFVAMLVGVVTTCVLVWPVLTTRVGAEGRLEAKSLNQRATALQNGVELLRRHPLFGVGFGGTKPALVEEGLWPSDPKLGPPEPPHNVPILTLLEMGLVPFMLLCVAGWFVVRRSQAPLPSVVWPLWLACLPILLLDHYLWSFWSGKVLVALVLASSALTGPTLDPAPQHSRKE